MTNELAFHLMMRLGDDRVVAPSAAGRRAIARAVLGRGPSFGLLAFRGTGNHVHAAVACSREEAGEFARRVEISLQRRLRFGVRFSRVHLRPIVSQGHLVNTFWYVLNQEQRHGTDVDPLFEASNLPDLLGWRLLAPWAPAIVREHLPRIRRASLIALLPDPVEAERLPIDALTQAAAMVCCSVRPSPNRALDRRALVAAIHLADPGIPAARLGRALGIDGRTVRSLRLFEPDSSALEAVDRQARLLMANRTADAIRRLA
jgi:hypothetical protein